MHGNKTADQSSPYKVSLEFQDESGPFLIDVELSSVDGRVACVAFAVRSYARDGDGMIDLPPLNEVESVITASLLRRVKVGQRIAQAVNRMRSKAEYVVEEAQAMPESYEEWLAQWGLVDQSSERLRRQFEHEKETYRDAACRARWAMEQPSHEGRGPGRPPIPDEKLREVASLYSKAYRSGDSAPVKYVARELGLPHKLVKGRVVKARKKGFLPSTVPGTAQGNIETTEDSP